MKYEDEVLHERRGTSVLRSAPPELVVPTPWMCRRWTGALNSRLWPRACAETGKRASMWQSCGPRFSGRCLGWFVTGTDVVGVVVPPSAVRPRSLGGHSAAAVGANSFAAENIVAANSVAAENIDSASRAAIATYQRPLPAIAVKRALDRSPKPTPGAGRAKPPRSPGRAERALECC